MRYSYSHNPRPCYTAVSIATTLTGLKALSHSGKEIKIVTSGVHKSIINLSRCSFCGYINEPILELFFNECLCKIDLTSNNQQS